MADGIQINSGLSDLDLNPDLLDGTVKGVLFDFAQKLQDDLIASLDKNDHVTAASLLRQSLAVNPNIVEMDNAIIYSLKYPEYGDYLDKGVSGAGTPPDYKGKSGTVVTGSPFSYKSSSKPPFGGLIRYAKLKSALGVSSNEEAVSFGIAMAYRKKYFGLKPSYWLTDVFEDGRFADLEEALGKTIGLVITGENAKRVTGINRV